MTTKLPETISFESHLIAQAGAVHLELAELGVLDHDSPLTDGLYAAGIDDAPNYAAAISTAPRGSLEGAPDQAPFIVAYCVGAAVIKEIEVQNG